MRTQLPPLDLLVAFEAAARLLSFTAAAGELSLSQAAISQQIRNLENRLGVKLFERAHRAVSLTSAGREYQHTVSTLLNTLAGATNEIRYAQTRPKLTVAADRAAASLLLLPNLNVFNIQHPDISVRIVSSDVEADCLAADIDVAIIHGDGVWPGFESELLFQETVYPVCSADYLSSAPALESPDDLVKHTLLNLDDDHWDWMNWRVWLSGNGVNMPATLRKFEVNSYPLLIEAARNGLGIALGWDRLLDADLSAKRLVRPIQASQTTELGYFMLRTPAGSANAAAEKFRTWFTELLWINPQAGDSSTFNSATL